jgi:Post-segregation antitoxin CcdA
MTEGEAKNKNDEKRAIPDYREHKVRVNIALSKKVLEGAKSENINISSSCEEYLTYLLNTFAWEKRGGLLTYLSLFQSDRAILNEEALTPVSAKIIIELYDSLLYKIQLKLHEYLSSNTKYVPVEVGKIKGKYTAKHIAKNTDNKSINKIDLTGSKIFLTHEGISYNKDDKNYVFGDTSTKSRIRPKDVPYLYDPKEILRNAIISLSIAAKENKEKSQRLKFAQDFLEAIFKNSSYNSSESGSETPLLRRIREDVEAEERTIVNTNYTSNPHEERKEIITAV